MANGGDKLTLFVPADDEDAGGDGVIQQTSGGLMQLFGGGGGGVLGDLAGSLLRFGLVAVVLTLIIQGCRPNPVVNVAPTTLHFAQLNGGYEEKVFTVWNTGGSPLEFTWEIDAAYPWILDPVSAEVPDAEGNYDSDPPDGGYDKVVFTVALDPSAPADAEGTITITSNGGADVDITVTTSPDYNTQEFTAQKPFSLQNQTVTFTPTAAGYSEAVTESGADFTVPVPPVGEALSFGEDDVLAVDVVGEKIPFFGFEYDKYWVAAEGFVSFEDPSVGDADQLADHFSTPRITGLSGLDAKAGAAVYAQQEANGAFVTYEDVPLASSKQGQTASFQIQMLFDGTIVVTFLDVPASAGVFGLSSGDGLPADFVSTDFTTGPLKAAF